MPAYQVEWSDYNRHKASGGTFANYKKKSFLPFNNKALTEHLKGTATLGIYPLLSDNTSFLLLPTLTREIGGMRFQNYTTFA